MFDVDYVNKEVSRMQLEIYALQDFPDKESAGALEQSNLKNSLSIHCGVILLKNENVKNKEKLGRLDLMSTRKSQ